MSNWAWKTSCSAGEDRVTSDIIGKY